MANELEVGMLWYGLNLDIAKKYYEDKYGKEATTCHICPTDTIVNSTTMVIKKDKYILTGLMWLG